MSTSNPNRPAYGTREYYQYIGRKGGLTTAAKMGSTTAARSLAEEYSDYRFDAGGYYDDAVDYLRIKVSELASRVMQKAQDNVRKQGLPDDIAQAMFVAIPEQQGNGDFVVDIVVEMGDPDDPEDRRARKAAHAYEYGSGKYGPKGSTYPITPKNAKFLMFPFGLTFMPGSKFAGFIEGGKFQGRREAYRRLLTDGSVGSDKMLWNYVDHPGVRARPYLDPAIQEMRETIVREMKYEFASLFVGSKFEKEIKLDWLNG